LGKILRYLWNDFEFPDDKARARGLTNLSTEVADLLKELTTAGKRLGGASRRIRHLARRVGRQRAVVGA